ncbi:MAG: FAD-dependent oxidoreductase [Lachnospiraceae bacterium]|nr:FAD-dependent oxidoreductase [Lachnospiraceae bacterium]
MDNTTIDKNLYDAVVVGGGPAGLTAAMYLARACYRVLVIEKEKFGGQITITAEVVNYPGAAPQSGAELTETMRKQAESFGAEFMLADVKELDFSQDVKVVKTSRGDIRCLGVLLATGAHPRMIGFTNEAEFKGHGVAYCATCDGEFFTGKEVFVIGGGFAAAEESVFLTRFASKVTILIRGEDFSCAKEAADEARNHPKITVMTNTEVVSVDGDSVLRSITYKNNKTGEVTTYSPEGGDTFGVFVFAGYSPSTELAKGLCDLNEQGYVITDLSKQTTKEGLYAAGDVCIKTLRQVVTATGDGAIAATELEKYLAKMRKTTGLSPEIPVRRANVHKPADASASKASTSGQASSSASSGELLDDGMKAQLDAVFSRMASKVILEVHPDDRAVSAELKQYMKELSALTDKIEVREVQGGEDLPYVTVLREDGTKAGMTFHGAPGGHEFTSFVLGLYNAAGPGQPIADADREGIASITEETPIKVFVSLSCTMCPDLVVAAERIASLNDKVSVDVYDLNHFPAFKDQYNVMSVPCYIIGDHKPEFGKKNVEQLLSLIRG